MTNVSLLQTEIEKSGLKKKYIAQQLGLSSYGFALKARGDREFTASEIKMLCEVLKLNMSQMHAIFLA